MISLIAPAIRGEREVDELLDQLRMNSSQSLHPVELIKTAIK